MTRTQWMGAGVTVLAVLALSAWVLSVGLAVPSSTKDWKPGLERVAFFEERAPGNWRLENYRSFAFGPAGATGTSWEALDLRAEDLQEVWFFVEPFPWNESFGHTYLSFVFGGETDEAVAVSVEARMEKGESYSALKGIFRAYELAYVWSTEKDIHTRIAVNLGHDLYAYKLSVTPDQSRAILEHFIARTNALVDEPRFYNTLTSNCTNELAKSVNDAFPGALPWTPSFVLTGQAAKHLHRLGFLGPEKDFGALKDAGAIVAGVKASGREPPDEFAKAWRRGVSLP